MFVRFRPNLPSDNPQTIKASSRSINPLRRGTSCRLPLNPNPFIPLLSASGVIVLLRGPLQKEMDQGLQSAVNFLLLGGA